VTEPASEAPEDATHRLGALIAAVPMVILSAVYFLPVEREKSFFEIAVKRGGEALLASAYFGLPLAIAVWVAVRFRRGLPHRWFFFYAALVPIALLTVGEVGMSGTLLFAKRAELPRPLAALMLAVSLTTIFTLVRAVLRKGWQRVALLVSAFGLLNVPFALLMVEAMRTQRRADSGVHVFLFSIGMLMPVAVYLSVVRPRRPSAP
jgi:hypothetical protein